jgi:hypothetical protein
VVSRMVIMSVTGFSGVLKNWEWHIIVQIDEGGRQY